MSQAIESLMQEHRLIERVLGSLATFVAELKPGQEGARARVAEYARFFREFADRCHHGKEEDRLFAVLGEHGFPKDSGPVFVMLQEHDLGRAHVRRLVEVGGGEGELSEPEIGVVRAHATEFIPLLADHIQKEDRILYPAAERALPPAVLDTMAAGFGEYEKSVFGEEARDALKATADGLIEAFPPNMDALGGAGGGCMPCGG